MNDSNNRKIDAIRDKQSKAYQMKKEADDAEKALLTAVAKESGVTIGSVVRHRGGGDRSVTNLKLEFMVYNIPDDRVMGEHYVVAYGVPLTKAGVPMKRREPLMIGPVELLKVVS